MEYICDYLSVLNAEQLSAVCHTGSPLLILAGAGSGKTRVITTKIAWLIAEKQVPPESILAVTFTNKAAREMSERAAQMEPHASRSIIRTFHSFGAWMLRRYADWAGLSPNFTIYDDEDSVSLLMKAQPQLNKNEAQGFMRKISRAKDHCLLPDNPELNTIDPDPQFALMYTAYQQRLRETGNADFGDLILLPVMLLEEHSSIAAALHRRFKIILVDEYQDSNSAQFRFLKALTGTHSYICVVGDDDQSIYRFRGAEVENILTFEQHFENTKIIRLIQNYRSYAPILRVADSVVSHNYGRLGKTLVAARGENEQKPILYYLPNQDAEAELCIQLIKKAVQNGGNYRDWAILYRTNAQSLNFETAFLHQKIPYMVVGTLKFYEREEIKDTLALLALIANGKDEIAFRRLINKPARGIGEVSQNKLIAYARMSLQAMLLQRQETQELQEIQDDDRQNRDTTTDPDFISIMLKDISQIGISKKAAVSARSFLECVQTLRTLLRGVTKDTGLTAAIHSTTDVKPPTLSDTMQPPLDPVPHGQMPSGKEQRGHVSSADTQRVLPEQSSQKAAGFSLHTARGEGLAGFVQEAVDRSGLSTFHQQQDEIMGTQKTANIVELINTASLYPATFDGLLKFLEHIELDRTLSEAESGSNAVHLITMHNTKGLEFKNVIITGLENGIFPRTDESSEDIEEERRLMYVACTRAQDSLYMTSCTTRRMYGRLSFMQPSRFLSEIDPALITVVGETFTGNAPAAAESDAALWKCGQKVYHDDYGYGYVIESRQRGGELVIIVQFETGAQMRFFPVYQKNQLIKVDEW
ncbi:MAG: ATP-dependent helicase [Treponema sp.]